MGHPLQTTVTVNLNPQGVPGHVHGSVPVRGEMKVRAAPAGMVPSAFFRREGVSSSRGLALPTAITPLPCPALLPPPSIGLPVTEATAPSQGVNTSQGSFLLGGACISHCNPFFRGLSSAENPPFPRWGGAWGGAPTDSMSLRHLHIPR